MLRNVKTVTDHDLSFVEPGSFHTISGSLEKELDSNDKNTDSEHPRQEPSSGHNPSFDLHVNNISYKPEGFKILSRTQSILKTVVSFEYKHNNSVYDEYTFQIRYFGHHNYVTDKKAINTTEGVNEIVLHDFVNDKYIVCVTFYSSNNSLSPLSTSGEFPK